MKLFRERLLARLVEHNAISEDVARKLVAWTHPGFSSHVGEAIPCENKKTIEDLACYLVRAPFSLQTLVYLSPPEKPPPDIRDVVRVPVDEEERDMEVQPA